MVEGSGRPRRDLLYEEAVAAFGEALTRLARGYEADTDRRRDLLQEIHVALWRSLASFNGQCSLRTWVYRVAHNRAISLAVRTRDRRARLLALDDIEPAAAAVDLDRALDEERTLERVHTAIRSLNPIDREVILLYLEDLDAETIAEITGLSAANVATKVHRIKRLLIERGHP
jgi:RNA polymerase sigma-70 factor (ECF subfamily)